jgi:hypothetical protein
VGVLEEMIAALERGARLSDGRAQECLAFALRLPLGHLSLLLRALAFLLGQLLGTLGLAEHRHTDLRSRLLVVVSRLRRARRRISAVPSGGPARHQSVYEKLM